MFNIARWLTVQSVVALGVGTVVDLRPSRQKCQATADRRRRLPGIPTPALAGRPLNMRWDLACMSEVLEPFLVRKEKCKWMPLFSPSVVTSQEVGKLPLAKAPPHLCRKHLTPQEDSIN